MNCHVDFSLAIRRCNRHRIHASVKSCYKPFHCRHWVVRGLGWFLQKSIPLQALGSSGIGMIVVWIVWKRLLYERGKGAIWRLLLWFSTKLHWFNQLHQSNCQLYCSFRDTDICLLRAAMVSYKLAKTRTVNVLLPNYLKTHRQQLSKAVTHFDSSEI